MMHSKVIKGSLDDSINQSAEFPPPQINNFKIKRDTMKHYYCAHIITC